MGVRVDSLDESVEKRQNDVALDRIQDSGREIENELIHRFSELLLAAVHFLLKKRKRDIGRLLKMNYEGEKFRQLKYGVAFLISLVFEF
uniref:Transposase n=1 Tax=Caenorhabditis tropicalis TaxID=1561998 RepID=A0A1I7URF7_9PELO